VRREADGLQVHVSFHEGWFETSKSRNSANDNIPFMPHYLASILAQRAARAMLGILSAAGWHRGMHVPEYTRADAGCAVLGYLRLWHDPARHRRGVQERKVYSHGIGIDTGVRISVCRPRRQLIDSPATS